MFSIFFIGIPLSILYYFNKDDIFDVNFYLDFNFFVLFLFLLCVIATITLDYLILKYGCYDDLKNGCLDKKSPAYNSLVVNIATSLTILLILLFSIMFIVRLFSDIKDLIENYNSNNLDISISPIREILIQRESDFSFGAMYCDLRGYKGDICLNYLRYVKKDIKKEQIKKAEKERKEAEEKAKREEQRANEKRSMHKEHLDLWNSL